MIRFDVTPISRPTRRRQAGRGGDKSSVSQ